MAARPSVDVPGWLDDQLAQASPDLLRVMLKTFVEALLSADADAVCGAAYGERSPDRVNRRNGYREREWDTRAGTIDIAIPKLREGSYFPDWLLQRRRRAEQALTSVVATSYLLGVSTRRVEKLVETLGVTRLSKSQVSEMARSLDEQVAAFRNRPLDAGPYTFVWLDALTLKVREAGRTVLVHALLAVGVNADGQREVLGIDVTSGEDGAGWLAFLRSLVARGLAGVQTGVQLATSDAHPGLVESIGATLPGASWQRCRTHYARNLSTKVPKNAQPWVLTLLRTIFDQPDADQVHAQFTRVVDALEAKFPAAAEHLAAAEADLLAFTAFPREVWRQVWSNNPQERLNKEIRRRTDVVGIFPDRQAIIRLVGAVLAEQTDEWAEQRRYMGTEILTKARRPIAPDSTLEEVPEAITA
jgi:putative transposase